MERSDAIAAAPAAAQRAHRRTWLAWPAWFALVRRDLVAELRRFRSFVALVLVVGGCAIIVAQYWPWAGTTLQLAGQFSREMFAAFAMVLLLSASALPPGLAALAFSEERRQDTLDQLRLTFITAGGLVGAKLLASVGLVTLLLIATFPMLAVQLMLVGISQEQVLGVAAVAITTALAGASVGLLSAIIFRRPLGALVMAYLGTAFIFGGWVPVLGLPLVVAAQLVDAATGIEILEARGLLEKWGTTFIDATVGVYERLWSVGANPRRDAAAVAYRMVWAAFCTVWATVLLRRPPKPVRVPRGRPIDDDAALRVRRRRFPFYLVDPLRRRPPIRDGANPVFVRESRHGLGLRVAGGIRVLLITAILSGLPLLILAWPGWGSIIGPDNELRLAMLVETVGILLLVQVLVAGILAKEREGGHFDALRMTLLTPRAIIAGKVKAALLATSPILLGVLVGSAPAIVCALFMRRGVDLFVAGYLTLLTCVWFTLCLSVCVSFHARTTAGALAKGFVANAAVYGWPLVAIAAIGNIQLNLPDDRFLILFRAVQDYLSPLSAYAAYRTPDFIHRYRSGFWSFVYGLPQDNFPFLTWSGLIAVDLAFVLFGFALLAFAWRRFGRRGPDDA